MIRQNLEVAIGGSALSYYINVAIITSFFHICKIFKFSHPDMKIIQFVALNVA